MVRRKKGPTDAGTKSEDPAVGRFPKGPHVWVSVETNTKYQNIWLSSLRLLRNTSAEAGAAAATAHGPQSQAKEAVPCTTASIGASSGRSDV